MKYSLFGLLALLAYTLAVPLHQTNTEFLSNLDASKNDGRIIGGVDVDIRMLPWNLVLRFRESHVGSASIISRNRALTVASPYNGFQGIHPPHYDVLANSTTRIACANGVIVRVTSYIRHPEYVNGGNQNDIAVLYLETLLTFGPGMRAIRIPTQDAAIPYGVNAIVSGWGASNSQAQSSILQYTSVPLITNRACNEQYSNSITPNMVCAGVGDGRSACLGDRGAPLVANNLLVGVSSFGLGCSSRPPVPSVYSRVSFYANFIRSHLD